MSRLSRFQHFLLTGGFNLRKPLLLCIRHLRLSLGLLLSSQPGFFRIAFGGPAGGFFLLSLLGFVKFRLNASGFEFALPSRFLFGFGLIVSPTVESFLGELSITHVLLTKEVLNGSQFPVKALLGLSETHSGVLGEKTLCAHSALEVHLSLTSHHDKHQADGERTPQGYREHVILQTHGLPRTNHHLNHALCEPQHGLPSQRHNKERHKHKPCGRYRSLGHETPSQKPTSQCSMQFWSG